MERKIGRIGWNGAQEDWHLLLLSRKDRQELGVEVGDVVKVSLKTDVVDSSIPVVSAFAVVHLQFKDLIDADVASVNKKLADDLLLQLDNTIVIDKEVTESEYTSYKTEISTAIRNQVGRMLPF